MKKTLLLLLAMVVLPMTMGAQIMNAPQAKGLLHRSMSGLTYNNSGRLMAPAKADLAENQKIMGHYDTDDLTTDGLGITGLPGTIPIATILEPDELAMFLGGKIVKFRVGLAAATPVTRVFVAPVDERGTIGTMTEWTASVRSAGWNEITLDTPYQLDMDETTALMIGFDYAQTSSNYPISAVEVGEIYPSYIYYQNSWQNVGLDSYGNLSLQCVVEKDDYPDYMLRVANLKANNFVKMGQDLEYNFKAKNGGMKTIEAGAVNFEVKIDGVLVETITNAEALSSDFVDVAGAVTTEGLVSGSHELSVTPVSMNGETIENPTTLTTTFKIFTNVFPRQKHIVEQFTSTYCTWCPLGSAMLAKLTDMRDDVIKVGIHGNMNGTDPFKIAQCDTIMSYMGANSYPSAAFDRMVGWEDDATLVNGIGYYEEYSQQVAEQLSSFFDYVSEIAPSFATIKIKSDINKETREAQITVSGDITSDFDDMMGTDAKLTVYLTEDSLIARQLNQGTWVAKYEHEGVFRQALGSVFGVNLNKDGETYSNVFTYTIPEAWNMDKMNIIAFIGCPLTNGADGDYSDMYINNAEFAKLINNTGGVDEMLVDDDAVPVAYYDVMGREHSTLQQGINIVKMSNGTAKKVLVK